MSLSLSTGMALCLMGFFTAAGFAQSDSLLRNSGDCEYDTPDEMIEGTSLDDRLYKGELGIIASSDHLTTCSSYAGVWAEENNKEAMFRALQARRVFGATDKIRLAFWAGNHCMGECLTAETLPTLQVDATGTATISKNEFIVDGKVHKTLKPNAKHVRLSHDTKLSGKHCVWVHLVQSDGNQAWSSPIWFVGKASQNAQ